MHVLGYNINVDSEPIKRIIEKSALYRQEKIDALLQYLYDKYRIKIPDDSIKRIKNMSSPGKPHIVSEKEVDALISVADEYGLCISGGSDFHGARKNLVLGKLGGTKEQLKQVHIKEFLRRENIYENKQDF